MALNENLPQATSPNSMTNNTRPSQEIERVDKLYDSVLMKVTKMEASLKKSAEYMREISRNGSNATDSKVNIGGQNPNIFGRTNDVTQATMDKLNQVIPPGTGPSGWDRAKAIGSSAMYYAAAVMPNTLDAVTQRISTQGVASMIGMDPNALIRQSNQMLRGGMTGPYSAQTSTAILASQGIIPTMGSYGNIMNQVGGLSVLTGMSNEQVAAGMGGINGMNFLRMGINARTASGAIKDPASLSNDLYQRMFGGRNITAEQAAQVFNTHSRSYQNIAMAAGGDQALIATLQNTIYYQAQNGGKKLNLDPKNVKNNILKLPSDDPTRAMFNYQGSEAGKLEATGTGLVGGYSGALNTTAFVNDQFTRLAKILPALTTAFGNLKGFLDTLPTAGNTGAAMYGGIAKGMQSWADYKGGQFMSKALDKIFGTNFSGGGQPGMPGAPGNALVPYTGGGGPVTPMGAINRQMQGFADKGLHAMWGKLTGKEGQKSLMQDIKGSGGLKSWAKDIFRAGKDAITGYAQGGVKGAIMKAGKDLAPRLGQAVLAAGDSAFGYGDQTQTGGWGNQISMQPVGGYPGVAGQYYPSGPSPASPVQYPQNYPGAVYGDPNDPSKITWVPGMVRDPVTGRFVSNMEARNAWLASQGQAPGTDLVPYTEGQSKPSDGDGNILMSGSKGRMANLFSKGKTFMRSPMGKVAGRFALAAGTVMATNWAVPKLRQWGAKHGIKDHSWQDNAGTTLGYMGGYAAAGAMMFGPAGAVVGALAGLARGLWYSTHKPKKQEGPKTVKHTQWGGIIDPETREELLHRNMITGELIPTRPGQPAYGNNYPDQNTWQNEGYSNNFLNPGHGSEGNLVNILKSAGFKGDHTLDVAYAVAMAESRGNARSHNTTKKTEDNSYGLFQINMFGKLGPARRKQYGLKSNEDLFDPLTNAKIAYKMSSGGKYWGAWSTYKSGAYEKFLGQSGEVSSNTRTKVTSTKEKSDMPRSASEAAKWAIEQTKNNSGGWNNYCERFVESAWGKTGRYKSAIAHWQTAVKEGRAYQGKNPPPGAFVFWGGGQYGHAAISIGNGKIVSTDIKRKDKADIVTIDYLTKKWGKPYLGWTNPSKGTVLDKNASAIDPGTVDSGPATSTDAARNDGQPWWRNIANDIGNFFSGNRSNNNSASNNEGNSESAVTSTLNVTGTGFTVNSTSTSSLLGWGNSPSSMGSNTGGITINMNVNIAQASISDAQRLARQVKDILEKDVRVNNIRNY